MNNSRFFTLLPILLFVFGLKLTAQTDTPYERKIEGAVFDSYDFRRHRVIGYDTNGAFCYQNIKDMPQLVHISHQLATLKTYEIPTSLTNAGREFEFVDWINPVMLGDKICLFYKEVVADKNAHFRLIHTINISDFKPLNTNIEMRIENGSGIQLNMASMQIQNVESSPDHSRLMHYIVLTRGKPDATNVMVFRHTTQIDKYTETTISFPYSEGGYNRIEQATIDNLGNAYFLVCENFDKARAKYAKKNNLPTFEYAIYTLPKGSDVPVKKELNIPGMYITTAYLSLSPENELICTGFNLSKELSYTFMGSNSCFYIRYGNEKQEVVSQAVTPLGAEFIEKNGHAVVASGYPPTNAELKIRRVINQNDGTSIMFSDISNSQLVISAFSKQGELLWKECIYMRIIGYCALFVSEKSVHVLCSDIGNNNVELNHYAINIKSGATKRTTIESDPDQLSILGESSGSMSSNVLLAYAKKRMPTTFISQYLLFDFSNR